MTDKAPKLLLDALQAAQAAREFIGPASLADYVQDRKTRSAVERQLEILGEACGRLLKLEPGLGTQHEFFKLAVGLRNRIIHGYDGIDDEIVYQTVLHDVEPMAGQLAQLLRERIGQR